MQKEDVAWCNNENLKYYLVSAKTGRDVHEAINDVAKMLKSIKPRE